MRWIVPDNFVLRRDGERELSNPSWLRHLLTGGQQDVSHHGLHHALGRTYWLTTAQSQSDQAQLQRVLWPREVFGD